MNEKRNVDLPDNEEMEFRDDGGHARKGGILNEFQDSHFNSWVLMIQ